MRHIASALAIGILAAAIVPSSGAQTPVRDRLLPRNGTSSIQGRVLAAGTGTPLRNVRVQATSDLGAASPVFTDAEGRFVISSLAPGRYRLATAKPGYLRINFGSQRFGDAGTPIDVADRALVDGVEVRLTKAAAISGRIVDSLGDPVIGMTVTAGIASPASSGQAAPITVATAQTDDLGAYRLGGLPEGMFLVSVDHLTTVDGAAESVPTQYRAATGILMARSPEGRLMTVALGPRPDGTRTYYPGAIDLAQAQPIAVTAGEERTPIDVVVAATPPKIVAPPPWGEQTEPYVTYGRGIRGRITRSDGRALANALVRLASPDKHLGFPPITATNPDGRYEFRRLPAGPYTVIASRPGTVTRAYGQRRESAAGETIDLRSGEWLERVDVSLPLTGAIAGRLVDDGGDPVEGASMRVLQVRYESGRRRLVEVAGVRPRPTDDTGRYRIHGLQPGEYIVSARVGQTIVPAGGTILANPPQVSATSPFAFAFAAPADEVTDLSGYATTYLPGTPNAGEAQRIAVGLSQEVPGADFALARVPMARVAGTVVDAGGRPVAGPVFMSRVARSGIVDSATVVPQVQGNGTFEFQNVAPGDYFVQASGGGVNPAIAVDVAGTYVTVSGIDVTGLVVRISSGSKVEGRVTLEGHDTPDIVRVIELTEAIGLSARPADPDRAPSFFNGFDPPIHIFTDQTFRLAGVRGPLVFRLTRASSQWALKAVRLKGVDVTDTPLEFGTAEQSVTDLEVVLTDRVSEISGRVTDTRGRAVADCAVVIFATTGSLWSQPASRFLTMVRAGRDGTFRAAGLPPARYYVAAVDRLLDGEWQDPQVLESLVPGATDVFLDEGQKLSVNPRLIAR